MTKAQKITTALIAIVALSPLMLAIGYMFDSEGHAMFFFTQDKDYLEDILTHGWLLMYGIFLIINKLFLLTGIPAKVFMNILAVVSILGTSWETYKYLRTRFNFSHNAAIIGAWGIIVFPVWHVFMSCVFSSHMFCIWLFMIAMNLIRKKIFLALPILLVSLNLFSLFPLAVGFVCVEFILEVDKKNYLRKGGWAFLLCLALVGIYLVMTTFINVHGYEGNYNTFSLDRLVSFANFGIMAGVVLAIFFVLRRFLEPTYSERLLRLVLCYLALAFFAGFAYWAVGRPMRYFSFGSFGSRHAILTCIPFAMLLAIGAEVLFKRWGQKVMFSVAGFILTVSVVLLYQGYDHKAAALLFKDMLVSSLKKIEAPESGYVSIAESGYRAPHHVHMHSINMCFYRAYGRSAWMANGFWSKRGHVYSREDVIDRYTISDRSLKLLLAGDVTGKDFTRYDFILENYRQEGFPWYWYHYLAGDYSHYNPRLVKISTPS